MAADITTVKVIGTVTRGGRKDVSFHVAHKEMNETPYIDVRKYEGTVPMKAGVFLGVEEAVAIRDLLTEAIAEVNGEAAPTKKRTAAKQSA